MTDIYQPQPSGQPPRPGATLSGVAGLFGRIVGAALIVGAGVAGWIGVDQLALAQEGTVSLPQLGDGLPTAHLDEPEPWRRFQLTYSYGTHDENYWFDLDTWKIRSEVVRDGADDQIEIHGDRGFRRSGVDGVWLEQDATTTRDISSYIMGGVGPFLLTDLVPPDALGFTTLELEGTSKGERVYEVAVDAATLREQHPLAYQRWVTSTRIIGDGSSVFRIRVREDGYVVRIDGDDGSAKWAEVLTGLRFESPLASPVVPGSTLPALDAVPPVGEVPAVPAPAAPVTVVPVTVVPVTVAPAAPEAPTPQD